MRSSVTEQQFERALALMEAQQSLETERRSLSEAQRASDREHLERMVESVRYALLPVISQGHQDIMDNMQDLHAATMSKLTELGEKLDRLYEIVGIPRDENVPTLAEQLNAAQSDVNVRKQIQNLFAEMEFENTEVEYG